MFHVHIILLFLYILVLHHSFYFFGGAGSSIAVYGLSLVTRSGCYSSLRRTGSRLLGSVAAARGLSTGSVLAVHRLSCSEACGVFQDQGRNPCFLHGQVDSQPLDHQESKPCTTFLIPGIIRLYNTANLIGMFLLCFKFAN